MKLITLDDAMSVFDDFTCGNLFEDDRHDLRCMLEEKVAEPKMGHWIMSEDGLYRPICNKCDAHPWKGYIPTVDEATETFKYCPNCGSYNGGEGDTE